MFTYGIRHLLTDHTRHGPVSTARLRMASDTCLQSTHAMARRIQHVYVWHQTPAYRPHTPWPGEYSTFTYGIRHLLTEHTRHGPANTACLRMASDTCLQTTHAMARRIQHVYVWHQTPAYRAHTPWPGEYSMFTYGIRHLLTDHTRHGPANTACLRMASDTCLQTTHAMAR